VEPGQTAANLAGGSRLPTFHPIFAGLRLPVSRPTGWLSWLGTRGAGAADGGKTWDCLNEALQPPIYARLYRGFAERHAGAAFLEGVFLSQDAGNSWLRLGGPAGRSLSPNGKLASGFGQGIRLRTTWEKPAICSGLGRGADPGAGVTNVQHCMIAFWRTGEMPLGRPVRSDRKILSRPAGSANPLVSFGFLPARLRNSPGTPAWGIQEAEPTPPLVQ
jgi:hypothetical protein